MSEPLIEVRNLTKSYQTPAGPLSVLRGVDLTINKGEFVALVGPSGSGKTTFLNMITGIDQPTNGEVIVDGVNITHANARKLTKWRARNVGIIFQFFQLLPTISVVNNVIAPMDFGSVWKPRERRDRAITLLDTFGIKEQADKTPDMLSGGQQQRVALARALANDPMLIIGDEPTGNLDRMSAANVFDQLSRLCASGTTVIVVTHDRELVRQIPTILEIKDGMIGHTTIEAAAKRRTQELEALRTQSIGQEA